MDTRSKFPVHAQVSNWHRPAELARQIREIHPTGAILWQYVPHMYGRRGINTALPGVMRRFHGNRRQVVLAHEMWSNLSWNPGLFLPAVAHRLQWRRIQRHVDAIGVSTEAWLINRLGLSAPFAGRFFLAPSASNIPRMPTAENHPAQWRRERGIAPEKVLLAQFGAFAGGRQASWLISAWRATRAAGIDAGLVTLGGGLDLDVPDDWRSDFHPLGYMTERDVSLALQAVDALLVDFVDGISERRSSLMTAFQHGVAVVGTNGESTGPSLRQAGIAEIVPATDPTAFAAATARLMQNPGRRISLGTAAHAYYQKHLDWPVVMRRLRSRLEAEDS